LGSYKNKASALRLVNRLRANGYSAFIQQASAETSVYVGPETKENIARSIATRLEYEMKLQVFVISYKPLTL
jgi:cell division septation protein DedD